MFSTYEYLIVNFDFPTSDFGVGFFFLIAPFPDHCLLVHFSQWWFSLFYVLTLNFVLFDIYVYFHILVLFG